VKILYGVTPPRSDYSAEKIGEISAKRLARFEKLSIDGLVLYDVQSEEHRIQEPRPYPWLPTLPPLEWERASLASLSLPRIYYRPVGKDTPETLKDWLLRVSNVPEASVVFVGASSRNQPVTLSMKEACLIKKESFPEIPLGGIAIPERHVLTGKEHFRLREKMDSGCSFFITQCIYDLQAALDFVSDYHYLCREEGIPEATVYFTMTPCGSLQTLEFMKWLGIGIPRWLTNDLSRSESILAASVKGCLATARQLHDYCLDKGIPHGFNIESVSIRKEEIEASAGLVEEIRRWG
jgi:hypothetical protein